MPRRRREESRILYCKITWTISIEYSICISHHMANLTTSFGSFSTKKTILSTGSVMALISIWWQLQPCQYFNLKYNKNDWDRSVLSRFLSNSVASSYQYYNKYWPSSESSVLISEWQACRILSHEVTALLICHHVRARKRRCCLQI